MDEHARWLSQVEEEAIEPERPIVDPHHHLWREAAGMRYLLEDLWADTATGHNIVETVFVECLAEYRKNGPDHLKPVGETEFVAGIAERSRPGGPGRPPIGGIVGFADLARGAAVDEVLVAHIAAAGGLMRGIRHAGAFDPSPGVRRSHHRPPEDLYLDPVFRDGFKRLKMHELSFDAWLYHPQIHQLTDLARAFPETTIVADHFLCPLGTGPYKGQAEEVRAAWRAATAELARCPNVFAKLGGLVVDQTGLGWEGAPRPPTSDELVAAHCDFYLFTIDAFGPARCMFESNFPVDKLSLPYAVIWNAFKKMAAGFSEDEKDALFRGTAARAYRLEGPGRLGPKA